MDIQDIIAQLNKEKDMISKEISEKQQRLNEIQSTIKNILTLSNNTKIICPECSGEGKYFTRSCAEDDGNYVICRKCKGIGRISICTKK